MVYDPLLDNSTAEFGIKVISNLKDASGFSCVILAVGHDAFRKITLAKLIKVMNAKPVLIDVRGFFDGREAEEKGIYYRTL